MATTTVNDTGYKAFTATAVAIEKGIIVVLDSSGTISAAAVTDCSIGVTTEYIAASGTGTVKLWGAPGTFEIQAAGVVHCGDQIYAAASGEIDDSGTYKLNLVALQAASAQGDIIECGVVNSATYSSTPYATTDVGTVAAAGSLQATATAITKMVTYVTGCDDVKGVVLPTAAAGLVYEIFADTASKDLLIYPNTSDKINNGSANAAVTVAEYTLHRFVAQDGTNWAMLPPT
jgi:hypothetical protein